MTTFITREQGYAGFSPEIERIVTTATITQVLTPGWFNNSPIAGESLSNVDVVLICYSYGTAAQQTSFFDVAISSKGIVTLTIAHSLIAYVDIPISLAQWTSMWVTPIQLVPSPGSNAMLVARRMVVQYNYGSAALTLGGIVFAQYSGSGDASGPKATNTEQASDFTGATASTVYYFNGASGNASQLLLSGVVNEGLFLTNATQNFTGGTGATFNAKLWYSIVPTNS